MTKKKKFITIIFHINLIQHFSLYIIMKNNIFTLHIYILKINEYISLYLLL